MKPIFLLLALSTLGFAAYTPLVLQDHDFQSVFSNGLRVPVTLGVESRDTDTLVCQSVFDQVLKRVADKVDMSFAYVAHVDASNSYFGVSCMNGLYECAANVQQLCVRKYADSLTQWWQFVMCQNYHGREKIGSPDLAHQCIRNARIDLEGSGISSCIGADFSGATEEGKTLLQENVRSAREANIDRSCTVVINNTPVCVRDGAWRECEDGHSASDFARQINDEWHKINNLVALDE